MARFFSITAGRAIRIISCGPFVRPKQAHVPDALPMSVKNLGEHTQVAPGVANSIPAFHYGNPR
jgi:hypothetical protein